MSINGVKDAKGEETENKTLCSFIIDGYIYDIGLLSKVKEKLQNLTLSTDANKIYTVTVYFDKRVYQNSDFYTFPLERKQWQIDKLEKLDTKENKKL